MFGIFQQLGPLELGIILLIVLIIFGPGKLPSVGKAIGRSISEFKKARAGELDDDGTENKKEDKS